MSAMPVPAHHHLSSVLVHHTIEGRVHSAVLQAEEALGAPEELIASPAHCP